MYNFISLIENVARVSKNQGKLRHLIFAILNIKLAVFSSIFFNFSSKSTILVEFSLKSFALLTKHQLLLIHFQNDPSIETKI